jgi:transcriptional regulator with XRE-family HTH domain
MAKTWDDRDRLAQRLRHVLIDAREAAGLTQTQLAEAVGKSQSFVSNYERGQRRLDVTEFVLIAAALRVDAKELIDRLS